MGSFGTEGSGNGQFKGPAGIAFSGGNIYVVDQGNSRVFEGCSVEGNGQPCEPEKRIETEPLKDTLAFSNQESKKGETLLQVITPTKGTVFLKLKFSGFGCTIRETVIEGSVGAVSLGAKEKPVKVEETEGEGEAGFVNFPATTIKVAWTEEEGKRKERKLSLKAFGKACALEGRTKGTLTSKEKGGVFTK